MITEIAQIEVLAGSEAGFEAAVREAVPLFLDAVGCHGLALTRSVEVPGRYRLAVEWESVEHHTSLFRGSPAFAAWRALVSPFLDGPPVVEHVQAVGL